jgi:hypothetical protein
MCGLMYPLEMHYVLGLLLSQVYCFAVVSKCIGLAMEEVPEKCWPFEATVDLAVNTSSILGCLSLMFCRFLFVSPETCTTFYTILKVQ